VVQEGVAAKAAGKTYGEEDEADAENRRV